jgi:transcription initiation factor IIF auxiliary subunit
MLNPNGFEIKTQGWGTFELKAFVHFKDGTKQKLTHELQLELEQNPPEGFSD